MYSFPSIHSGRFFMNRQRSWFLSFALAALADFLGGSNAWRVLFSHCSPVFLFQLEVGGWTGAGHWIYPAQCMGPQLDHPPVCPGRKRSRTALRHQLHPADAGSWSLPCSRFSMAGSLCGPDPHDFSPHTYFFLALRYGEKQGGA